MKNKNAFFNLVNNEISSDLGKKIMTIAEQLRVEGVAKGKLEVAQRLLAEGADISFVAKITGLSLDKLRSFQDVSV